MNNFVSLLFQINENGMENRMATNKNAKMSMSMTQVLASEAIISNVGNSSFQIFGASDIMSVSDILTWRSYQDLNLNQEVRSLLCYPITPYDQS